MKYIASPYTHKDPEIERVRYMLACQAAAHLMRQGHVVFSPIAHSHTISKFILKNSHEFWMAQDLPILEKCDEMIVLTLPGWEQSKGIKEEINFAESHSIPVRYMDFCEVLG